MAIYPDTDRTMLEKILSGDEVSWQEFYQRYSTVVRILCRISRLPQEKHDDVVQEVMSRFARRSSSYIYAPERARFRSYFNRIVRAAIADEFRKLSKAEQLCTELQQDTVLLSPEWESAEMETWRSAVLQEALQELSSRVSSSNYLAFTMSVLQHHSIRDTAAFLGMTSAQVYMARSRCTALLRKIISRCNNADPELKLDFPEKE